jgi:hypothetical protein
MRFKLPLALVGLWLIAVSLDHPMHVSTALMTEGADHEWTLQKILFTEDLETAINQGREEKIHLGIDSAQEAQLIDHFLQDGLLSLSFTKRRRIEPIELTLTAYHFAADEIKLSYIFVAKRWDLYDASLMKLNDFQENIYTVMGLDRRYDIALFNKMPNFSWPRMDLRD